MRDTDRRYEALHTARWAIYDEARTDDKFRQTSIELAEEVEQHNAAVAAQWRRSAWRQTAGIVSLVLDLEAIDEMRRELYT